MNITEQTILLAVFSSLLQSCDNTGQPGPGTEITEGAEITIETKAPTFGTWGVDLSQYAMETEEGPRGLTGRVTVKLEVLK